MQNKAEITSKNTLDHLLIFALMVGMFVSGLDISIVNVILPKIQLFFSASLSQTMLIATAYLTFMSAFQLLSGRCADIFSSRIVFLSGLVLFFFGSLACVLSQSIEQLIFGRGVQGVGSAVLAASFGAIILTHVPREKTGRVLGSVMMVMSMGMVIGPPLGGFLAKHLSWHWAFLLNLPLTAVSAVILLRILKNSRPRSSSFTTILQALNELDLKGAFFSVATLVALPAMLTVGPAKGWSSPAFLAATCTFSTCFSLFIWAELTAEKPLIQLKIFQHLRLNLVLIIKGLTFVIMNGVMLVFPFFITGSSSMDVSQVGLFILLCAAAMALATPVAGRMSDHFNEINLIIGAALSLIAVTISAFYIGVTPSKIIMGCVLAGFGAALSFLMVASSLLILKQAPKGQEGVFSALNTLVVPVAGSVGLAIFSGFYGYGEKVATKELRAYSGFTISMEVVLVCVVLLLVTALAYKSFFSKKLLL